MDKLNIVYEDDYFVVVDKPHGLHVINDRYNNERVTLKYLLEKKYGKIYIVHRLDAGTGGLIISAKDKKTHKDLNDLFATRQVIKQYLCITEGAVDVPVTLMLPISRRNYHGRYKINFKSGKRAITSFYPIVSNMNVGLVMAIPFTGRTHQIRVHLKALKKPLYIDKLYNKQGTDNELTLFSYFLSFRHPVTNKLMNFKQNPSSFFHGIMIKYHLAKSNKIFT